MNSALRGWYLLWGLGIVLVFAALGVAWFTTAPFWVYSVMYVAGILCMVYSLYRRRRSSQAQSATTGTRSERR